MVNHKFNRTNFLNSEINDIDQNNNQVELDLSSSYFYLFKTTRPIRKYQLDRWEKGRPDMLSQKIYGQDDYWWVLLKYNNIMDPYEELVGGVILEVPDVLDIQDFYSTVKKKKKQTKQAGDQ